VGVGVGRVVREEEGLVRVKRDGIVDVAWGGVLMVAGFLFFFLLGMMLRVVLWF
jgi:hypothetical protein